MSAQYDELPVPLWDSPEVNIEPVLSEPPPEILDELCRGLNTAGLSKSLGRTDDLSDLYRHTRLASCATEVWHLYSGVLADRLFRYSPESHLEASIALLRPTLQNVFTTAETGHAQQPSVPAAPVVNESAFAVYRETRDQSAGALKAVLDQARRNLDSLAAAYARRPPRELVTELMEDIALSQLTVARALSVSPTAVRKWRRGDSARPEHRSGLARLAALCKSLSAVGLYDPGSWIDIPISTQSTLTPLDLFIGGRSDLLLLLAANLADSRETLDAFHPNWREVFARNPDYEVVRLTDGTLSAVPRPG